MENVTQIKEYFDIIWYNFFKKSIVLEAYDGTQLKHFNSTKHVYKNNDDIFKHCNWHLKPKGQG